MNKKYKIHYNSSLEEERDKCQRSFIANGETRKYKSRGMDKVNVEKYRLRDTRMNRF